MTLTVLAILYGGVTAIYNAGSDTGETKGRQEQLHEDQQEFQQWYQQNFSQYKTPANASSNGGNVTFTVSNINDQAPAFAH